MTRPGSARLRASFLGALALLPLLGCPSRASAELIGVATSTPGALYSVNQATGAATLVGGNGAVVGLGIDGLAWRSDLAAVPEPGTLALTGLGMLGILGWLRRRKKNG